MVTVELKGGLGNQLFQYAAGLALAFHHKTNLKVDIESFKTADTVLGTHRNYKLQLLNPAPTIIAATELAEIYKPTQTFTKIKNIFSKSIFKEKTFEYHPSFWHTASNVLLKGNFQSYLYSQPFKTPIINLLQFNEIEKVLNDEQAKQLTLIKTTNNISIHIRRGDYLTNQIANDVLGIQPIAYYETALTKLDQPQHTFVFSDDIAWAKNNLPFLHNPIFIDNNGSLADIIDFYFMQHCTHNIIANSSFSWWAAYLNPNTTKKIIAPKKWFNKVHYNTKDLYPPDWILV